MKRSLLKPGFRRSMKPRRLLRLMKRRRRSKGVMAGTTAPAIGRWRWRGGATVVEAPATKSPAWCPQLLIDEGHVIAMAGQSASSISASVKGRILIADRQASGDEAVANLSLMRVRSRPPSDLMLVRRIPIGLLPLVDEGLNGSAVGSRASPPSSRRTNSGPAHPKWCG